MIYYTYAYLREDRTPYYIGKGKGGRAYKKGSRVFAPPKDKSRIIFLKQNLTEEEAFKHEIYMIAVFGRKDLGTGILHNRTNGGDGVSGFIKSKETLEKMSISMLGKNNPNYGKTGCNSAFYGRKHTKETLEKMSENRRGNKNAFYGRKHNEESKRKMRQNNKGHSGILHNEEAKEKMRNAKRKNYKFVSPNGDLIEEMTSLKEFAKKYELQLSGLSRLINKKYKHHKGWTLYELEH